MFSLVFLLVCLVTTASAQSDCGQTLFTEAFGTVYSPNWPAYYGSNENCSYDIVSPEKDTFHLHFRFFYLDLCCECDWLEISCVDNPAYPPQRYCRDYRNYMTYIYECSQVHMSFKSDATLDGPGFHIEYNRYPDGACGVTDYYGPSGVITSPNHPANYNSSLNCDYIVFASPESSILFEFTAFSTEINIDIVTISCLTNSSFPPRQFSGHTLPESVLVPWCSQGRVHFNSDYATEYTGFSLNYTITGGETTTAEPITTVTTAVPITTVTPPITQPSPDATIPSETTNVPAVTTGILETTPAPPQTTVPPVDPVCGKIDNYGPYGLISSPNYPLAYNNDLDCTYYVHASEGSTISFIFKTFNVEFNQDFVTISCPSNASFTSRTFSGQSLPELLSISWCSQGIVNFRTDSTVVLTGFSLNYYVSDGGCGNTIYNGTHGYVTTPNWPSDYGNDHSCLNIIWAPERSTFYLNFLAFFLHSCCSCDWLEISCLDNSDHGPLRYCGSYSYDTLPVYQCSQVLLWFRSDGSFTNQGFNIEYNANLDGETGTTETPPTTPTPPAGCGYLSYDGPSGVITSPNFPGNYYASLSCQYHINAETGGSIALLFEHFDVQTDKDYITISCETTDSNFTEQRYTGHALPQPLSIPWCSLVSLYFFTDTFTEFSGYSIDYYVSKGGCGNTVYNESFGHITSPNYPGEYSDNHDCYNVIWAPQSSHINLRFLAFSVQGSEPCQLDWVEAYCLDNNPTNKHRFCGSAVYSADFYQCTQVLVWFHSDFITTFPGFDLEYNVYPDTACGEASYYGPSGVIRSNNFPDYYNNSLYCDYDIYALSSSASIAIIFTAFHTEQCCDFVTISCPTNSSFPPVTYSGQSIPSIPQAVSIPWCSKGRVNFATDHTIVSSGFSLDYHISLGGCGNTVYNDPSGSVSSPNYPSLYDNDQNCSNIIWASKSTSFSITFLAMNVEQCCDFVEISCLDNPAYGTHRFSGTTIPPQQTIPTCTQVLVWFFSDVSTTFSGFNLEYTVIPG